jgi:hypothetical protein
MRPAPLGWFLIGATLGLALWSAVALLNAGAWLVRGEVYSLRAELDSVLVTDGSGLCRRADVRRRGR